MSLPISWTNPGFLPHSPLQGFQSSPRAVSPLEANKFSTFPLWEDPVLSPHITSQHILKTHHYPGP